MTTAATVTRGNAYMGAPESGDDLLTTDEVLKFLGISRMTLERRMKAGRIRPANLNPALDRPKVLLFRRADVERLAGKTPPQSREQDAGR